MKKIFYLLFTIYCLAACDKKDTPDPTNTPTEESGTAKIIVKVIDANAATQTALSANVWLIPEKTGEVKSGFHDRQNGQLTFDDLENGASYDVFVYCKGYKSKVEIPATAKINPKESDAVLVQMTADTANFCFEKSIIVFGEKGSLAVADINAGNDKTVSWQVVSENREWVSFKNQPDTTWGDGSVIIEIDRNYIKQHKEVKSGKIIATASNGKSAELWIIVSGAGTGFNLGDVVTWELRETTPTSATISYLILNDTLKTKKIGIECSKNENFSTKDGQEGTPVSIDDITYSVKITGLTAGVTYYAKAYWIVGGQQFESNRVIEFKTNSFPPAVSMQNVAKTSTTATFSGIIDNAGQPPYTKKGFVYSLTGEPTLTNTIGTPIALTPTQNFTATVPVSANKTYNVKAYAINAVDTVYSAVATFTTDKIKPKLKVIQPTVIGTNSVTLEASIEEKGAPESTAYYFCYVDSYCSDYYQPYDSNHPTPVNASDFTDATHFKKNITGLDYNTDYIFRVYTVWEGQEIYSDNYKCFKTAWRDANVTTLPITAYGTRTATFRGRFNDSGMPEANEYGFCYRKQVSSAYTVSPGIKDNPTPANNRSGNDFYEEISGLEPNARYTVRAYARQENGEYVLDDDYQEFATVDELYVTIGKLGVQKTDFSLAAVNWNTANANCTSSTVGEKTWRLPTIEELRIIYENRSTIRGFAEIKTVDYIYTDYPAYWSKTPGTQPSSHYVKFFEASGDEEMFPDDKSSYKFGSPDWEIWSMHTRCVCDLP